MFTRLKKVIIAILFTAVVFLLLFPLLVLISVLLWVLDLPRRLGEAVNIEEIIRRIIFHIGDPDEMRRFRDDVLHIVESENKDSGADRWSLLREMDQAKVKIEKTLQNGEFAFTFIGGVSALLVGNVFGVAFGGIVISLVALIFSILVTARTIVTEVLCYDSIEHRNDPMEKLEVLHAWNTRAALKKGAVGIAILTAFASRSKYGYQTGIQILDFVANALYSNDDKWQAE
ncbi:hypothetical protein [Haloarchaeobius salinus]|uniref:hypothetical protein n=1 Tax=Haloarchaeobius salinus TaxID=1198298 RepID=UPI00210AFC93|nr:hypothetical protein [Haloarchaeobius salinus]